MPRYPGRNYFIVKHDLASFQVLPGYVWNSHEPPSHPPIGFRQILKGDRWIAFAYTTSGAHERAVSLVTGFYQAARNAKYGRLTAKAHAQCGRKKWAWLIKGKSLGLPLSTPVVIPPIASFLGEKIFQQKTVIRISKGVFNAIRKYTQTHRFDPKKIPCLGREPQCEQEIVAIIASGHGQFGIEKILRIRTRFPDMLVKITGKAEPVHLELELYSSSFDSHGHSDQVRAGLFKGDKKPVGVLCWIDDDRAGNLKRHVHQVYELQSLLREGGHIRW
jgi:hypothetical protein